MTKKRKELLSEDFLSDMETKSVSAEDVAGAPENVADDDFADLLGGLSSKQTAQPNAAQNEFEETVSSLKDAVNGLTVTVKEIKDAMAKQSEPAPAEEPAAQAEPEASPDVPPNVDLDSTPAPEPEGGEAEKTEPAPEDKPVEDKPSEGEEDSAEAEEENSQDEFRKEDATKSEAYQMNRKAGKLLNSNSGSIIGIVESGKLYKLDEMIMTAVKAKIREKINEAKANLKAEFLKEASEMPKAEPEMIIEEKKEEEEPKAEKTMSFLEKLKAAKACKGSECSEEKCDEKCESEEKKDEKDEKKEG
jgi:hypothetical protein